LKVISFKAKDIIARWQIFLVSVFEAALSAKAGFGSCSFPINPKRPNPKNIG